MLKTFDAIAIVFILIGAINWGTVGFFDWNMVNFFFCNHVVERVIYCIVGVSGVFRLLCWFLCKKKCCK